MSTTFQILLEGRVYVFSRRELKFEVTLEKAHTLLRGISKACTFETLRNGLAAKWHLQDDVVMPFGDTRQNLRFVCSFDLDQDRLIYSDETGHIQIPLTRLREPDSSRLQRSEFTPFELVTPPQLRLTAFPPPYQNLSATIPERQLTFTSRILTDLADQWRHVLRHSYAESTFLRLAKAIISIATCDFSVDEVFTRQHIGSGGYYVTILDVPSWKPYERHVFRVGGTKVILHQDLRVALEIAKKEARYDSEQMIPGGRTQQRYLLLSVRHVLICHVDRAGGFSHTAPTTLMDGITLPSSHAINLLLQGLSPARSSHLTPIHKLPMELQDRILEHTSKGSFEAARTGCVLDLGSPFPWTRASDWPRRGGSIQLFTSPSHRSEYSPVESKICFGDVFSGVSYR